MEEIISAKVSARESIKTQLQEEIPKINALIKDAHTKGIADIYYYGCISKATTLLLQEAGYSVSRSFDNYMRISWEDKYEAACQSVSLLKKLLKKLSLKIFEV